MKKSSNLRMVGFLFVLCSLILISGFTAIAGDNQEILKVRNFVPEDITSMDPAFHTGSEYAINLAIYSRLMKFKPESQELKLDAAKSVEVSEDGTVITFKLKEGIKFHQGYGELTAEDVKFSYERIIDPENESPYKSSWSTLDRVEVTGKYSGKLVLSKPLASLFSRAIPFTAGAIISKKAYKELGEEFATHPIGSGPYKWEKWEPNQKIVLERFEDYFGKKPDFEKVEVHIIQNNKTAEMAFDRGELDDTSISLSSFDRYKDKDDVNLHKLTTLRYSWLGYNLTEAPFSNIKVRKAIRYAVNTEEIIEGAYNGIPKKNNCMLPSELVGYWDNCPNYKQDIEKAKQLLKEAGYPDGFKVDLITASKERLRMASQIVQQQLKKIGIKTNIKEKEGSLYDDLKGLPPKSMHYASYTLNLDPTYWFEWFTCNQVGKWNFLGWCNEEYDKLLQKASTTTDREQQSEMFVEMQKLMHEDAACIFTTNGAVIHITKPNIKPAFIAQYPQYEYYKVKE